MEKLEMFLKKVHMVRNSDPTVFSVVFMERLHMFLKKVHMVCYTFKDRGVCELFT